MSNKRRSFYLKCFIKKWEKKLLYLKKSDTKQFSHRN